MDEMKSVYFPIDCVGEIIKYIYCCEVYMKLIKSNKTYYDYFISESVYTEKVEFVMRQKVKNDMKYVNVFILKVCNVKLMNNYYDVFPNLKEMIYDKYKFRTNKKITGKNGRLKRIKIVNSKELKLLEYKFLRGVEILEIDDCHLGKGKNDVDGIFTWHSDINKQFFLQEKCLTCLSSLKVLKLSNSPLIFTYRLRSFQSLANLQSLTCYKLMLCLNMFLYTLGIKKISLESCNLSKYESQYQPKEKGFFIDKLKLLKHLKIIKCSGISLNDFKMIRKNLVDSLLSYSFQEVKRRIMGEIASRLGNNDSTPTIYNWNKNSLNNKNDHFLL